MADRIFAGMLLVVATIYTVMAFTVIKAPFQYDPLGPESWPRLVGVLTIICCGIILLRPDVRTLQASGKTIGRLAALVGMLAAYAWLYQPLGFILSTWLFCLALSLMLRASLKAAVLFGAIAGVVGYLVCTVLLDLNLPAGLLEFIL
ncbi:tripartite tricarboxylate transporter TctB family protein [Aestuariispira ectoiniformans]|uniref:tripartite tricarboxylate transporter TctB family protein n=1 Tax=Aestuariispira ectoiniformans TaxID=2775080 RepID=UPI00223ABC91|nr:tripartite tricarboxylate transporter TctB family protein [Aestuariispira ectoiniformans]